MWLVDEQGRRLDGEFDVVRSRAGADIVLHSRSGSGASATGRNTEYFAVLERLLKGIATVRGTIATIAVDSAVARALPLEQRVIDLPYPLHLSPDTDAAELRIRITEGQRTVASRVTSGPGGNKHKRIKISVDLRTAEARVAELLEIWNTTSEPAGSPVGSPYRTANPNPTVRPSDVFAPDPSAHERALAGHARIQNALAEYVEAHGHEARSPNKEDPDFDIAWDHNGIVAVAEVKTLSGTDPIHQLRLGLGQVLSYRHALAERYGECVAILAVEHEPPEPWTRLCSDLGVGLAWPPLWSELPENVLSTEGE